MYSVPNLQLGSVRNQESTAAMVNTVTPSSLSNYVSFVCVLVYISIIGAICMCIASIITAAAICRPISLRITTRKLISVRRRSQATHPMSMPVGSNEYVSIMSIGDVQEDWGSCILKRNNILVLLYIYLV